MLEFTIITFAGPDELLALRSTSVSVRQLVLRFLQTSRSLVILFQPPSRHNMLHAEMLQQCNQLRRIQLLGTPAERKCGSKDLLSFLELLIRQNVETFESLHGNDIASWLFEPQQKKILRALRLCPNRMVPKQVRVISRARVY